MKEMMQRLNEVKYATTEARKEELLAKGFNPVAGKAVAKKQAVDPKATGTDGEDSEQPQKEVKSVADKKAEKKG